MFEAIFGSKSAERVLVYIGVRESGYGRDIASFFDGSGLTSIQKQLEKLERASVLYSESQGKTLVYRLNPRYALYKQLKSLIDKAVEFYPSEIRAELIMNRRRPRRKGKPLESA